MFHNDARSSGNARNPRLWPPERRGAIMVLVAVSTVALMSLLVLALDGGALQREKRLSQAAADAGALAGAIEISRSRAFSDTISASVKAETKRNGFENAVNGVTVTTTWPATGSVYGGSQFVNVTVQRSVPTFLASLFGRSTVTVTSKATAGIVLGEACFVVLDPTSPDALLMQNSATLKGQGCGVQVNSTSASGADLTGNQNVIDAPSMGVSGPSVAGSGTYPASLQKNVPPTPDPLAYLVMPAVPNTCNYGNLTTGLPTYVGTLNPGTYCGGIDAGGTVILNPGLYILRGGGLTAAGGGATIRSLGTGVTFLNTAPPVGASYTWGGIKISSGSVALDLQGNTDPSSALPGVLFYSDPAAPPTIDNIFRSGSVSRMDGTMYFPSQQVTFRSGATFTINGALVARKVIMEQSVYITFTGYGGGANLFALRRPTIVE